MYTRKEVIQYSALGIAFGISFAITFWVSTSLETIPNTVSWYLPAGVRLAFYALSPVRSWPFVYFFSRVCWFAVLHPGAVLSTIPHFQVAHPLWYFSNLIVTPAATMLIIWVFRRKGYKLDISNIFNTLKFFVLVLVTETILVSSIFARQAIYIDAVADILAEAIFNAVLGNIVGILATIPLILVLIHWFRTPLNDQQMPLKNLVTFWVCYMGLNAVCVEIYAGAGYYFKIIAILPAIYFSYRFGWRGAAITVFFICILTFLSAWLGGGTTLENQFYIISMSLTCLLLGAASSEAKQQRAQLKTSLDHNRVLSSKLIDAQELERKNLTQELHDDFGQRIMDIKLTAANTKRQFANTQTNMDRIIGKAEHLYTQLKSSIGALRPTELDEWGLIKTIEEGELASLVEQADMTLSVKSNTEQLDLTESQAIGLYRICQECVTNTVKHTKASQIEVSFTLSNASLSMKVCDNGTGFPVNKVSSGFGLVNIEERAMALGGSVNIHSDKFGTQALVSIPL